MTETQVVLLVLASTAAGIINAIAGGGTLLTFPALLACGLDPVVANATNSAALSPGALAAMYAFRSDLPAAWPWIRVLLPSSLAGGVTGAALLLLTPTKVFAAIVPFLILFATALLAFQAPVQRLLKRDVTVEPVPGWRPGLMAFQFAIGVYGGYFGAGLGIMMIASLSVLGISSIFQMIVVRNVCSLAANGIAAVYFIAGTAVSWPHAGVMVAGHVVGSYAGARLAKVLPAVAVRRVVVGIGAMLGVWLLWSWSVSGASR